MVEFSAREARERCRAGKSWKRRWISNHCMWKVNRQLHIFFKNAYWWNKEFLDLNRLARKLLKKTGFFQVWKYNRKRAYFQNLQHLLSWFCCFLTGVFRAQHLQPWCTVRLSHVYARAIGLLCLVRTYLLIKYFSGFETFGIWLKIVSSKTERNWSHWENFQGFAVFIPAINSIIHLRRLTPVKPVPQFSFFLPTYTDHSSQASVAPPICVAFLSFIPVADELKSDVFTAASSHLVFWGEPRNCFCLWPTLWFLETLKASPEPVPSESSHRPGRGTGVLWKAGLGKEGEAELCWGGSQAEGLSGSSVTVPSWYLLPNIIRAEWLFKKTAVLPWRFWNLFEFRERVPSSPLSKTNWEGLLTCEYIQHPFLFQVSGFLPEWLIQSILKVEIEQVLPATLLVWLGTTRNALSNNKLLPSLLNTLGN